MQSFAIVLMCIIAAVCYGIAHDQVTARVCVEYFTVGHPPVFGTYNLTLLGIGWGIIATWWVGLLLGVPLAVVARGGARPRRSADSLVRPIVYLLGVMTLSAFVAGAAGWLLASSGAVFLVGPIARELPPDRHVPFLADMWAHSASYLVGLIGGIVAIVGVWRSRGRASGPKAPNRALGQSAGHDSFLRPQVRRRFAAAALFRSAAGDAGEARCSFGMSSGF